MFNLDFIQFQINVIWQGSYLRCCNFVSRGLTDFNFYNIFSKVIIFNIDLGAVTWGFLYSFYLEVGLFQLEYKIMGNNLN